LLSGRSVRTVASARTVPRDRLPNRRGLKLGKRHLRLSAVALVKLVPDRRPSEHPGQQANASTYRSPTTATRDGTETGASDRRSKLRKVL
jgi:hypothetical protein